MAQDETLLGFLSGKKEALIARWLECTVQDYAEPRALLQEPDRFKNPFGSAFREHLPLLFDALLGATTPGVLDASLDAVVRIRVVQYPDAREALAFICRIKEIVRQEMRDHNIIDPDAIAAFETRVDGVALRAFDLFLHCQEQICAIKANEARRRSFVAGRIAERLAKGHS